MRQVGNFFVFKLVLLLTNKNASVMITEKPKNNERHEQAVAIIQRMIASKKAAEQEAIDDYKTNPAKQALVAKLDRENAERGTPVVKL